ncbi:MAG: YafY family protein [Cellvibrionaceae bacterium]
MDKFDRFQTVHRIFTSHRRPVPMARFVERLECSPKPVKRTFEQMRDRLYAPIEYCQEANGWHYVHQPGELFELPGLWLTAEELQSLVLLLHVLEGFGNGLLNEELTVMERQIHRLLEARDISPHEFSRRIKVLPLANKTIANKTFADVGEAILTRKQLAIRYKDYQQRQSKRTISPQTLIYYRENWYLDAWCHLRKGLRTFSLSRIIALQKLDTKATTVTEEELSEHFSSSFGLFAGKAKHMAKLRFLPAIAREIAAQRWHPDQEGTWEGEDYRLSIPYSDDRELVGDILRHMPNVVVEGPADLRKNVVNQLRGGLEVNQSAVDSSQSTG